MTRSSTFGGACLCLMAASLLGSAEAKAVAIGGVDAQSQYTGFTPVVADSGVFTFDDTLNGSNPAPEPGTVTTADGPGLAGLINGAIDLELKLDTSGFDPATDSILSATFLGTGGGAEVLIWDSPARNVLLLALDVSFVNVTAVSPYVPAFPTIFPCCGAFTIGQPETSTFGVESALTVTGGTFAGAVGGIGTGATLQVFISDPVPALISTTSFLNDDFTVGFNVNPSSEVVWEINFVEVPEPGTTLLVAAGVLALLRRRANLA